jgi:hypothetical protein
LSLELVVLPPENNVKTWGKVVIPKSKDEKGNYIRIN